MKPPTRFIPAVIMAALSFPASAQVVFDPSVFARQFDQLIEMKKQVETLSSQLKVAQDQLAQAKQLYDSFNRLTNANDVASQLNSSEFRKYLPDQRLGLGKFRRLDRQLSVAEPRLHGQPGKLLLRLRARSHRSPNRRQALARPGRLRHGLPPHRPTRDLAPSDQRLQGRQGGARSLRPPAGRTSSTAKRRAAPARARDDPARAKRDGRRA
ncbi:MAG: type IV secretion system protein VirB5 [Methylocystaceae bacterium]|nr:MAG: type IV secretion system protein VirB5 [Methylocystaceae bacterium]